MNSGKRDGRIIKKVFELFRFIFNPQDAPHAQPPSKPIRRKFRPENQTTESQEPAAAVGGAVSAAMVKPHPTVQK